ncbi:DUF6265 domain-containing protein [Sulfidibacter corallicola]|uniref:DUF6265 domain-containing protein n=1 Tax=Sulfidibacter corallicola TaxID=2818388 RepID=A0A8A4TED5_SULCO|nr:DUF6265 family protein [Sulfidibacter corallicola]QTD47920.1 hypothetical protein J3U87_20230 [Sulfidibacter corallicola]
MRQARQIANALHTMVPAKRAGRTRCRAALLTWLICLASLAPAVAGEKTPTDPTPSMDRLGWLTGHWRGEAGGIVMEEWWTAPGGQLLLGLHRDSKPAKEGAAPPKGFFEYLRIEGGANGIHYLASPMGREPTPFKLVRLDGEKQVAVFENPGHDYPQRIVYERQGDALVARIETIEGTKRRQWQYRRVGDFSK